VTPLPFTGERDRAEEFIDAVEDHFLLNHQFTPYHSFHTRIAYTLSLLQGPDVASWRRSKRIWLGTQPDNQDTYNQFIAQFRAQYLDTGKTQRARTKLRNLKMHWPHIDQYIIDFEQLVEDANFDKDHDESIQQFLMGLSRTVLDSVLKATHTVANPTYRLYRDTAINVTKTEQIFKALTGGGGPVANQLFQSRQFDNRSRQNFQQYPPRNNWYPQRNQNQRYNSSNAPRNMNNTAVPMDLDRSRANRQGRSYQPNQPYARLMEVGDPNCPQYQENRPRNRGPCFNCGQEGHFARNCTRGNSRNEGRGRRPTANLIDFDEGYTSPAPSYTSGPSATNKYDAIQNQIASMSKEEMEELTARFGAQDFQEA
jgi:Retrotransposon gag protein/Zinc knuckle